MSGSSRDVCSEAYVLDAAGLFASLPLTLPGNSYTTPLVAAEVIDSESKKSLEYALVSNKLVIMDPPKESIEKVREVARRIGELGNLSEADISILALAHTLLSRYRRVIVVTDDKSVQNVALYLGAEIYGIKRKTIRRPKLFSYVCPACGYESAEAGTCPVCGHKLRKRSRS
ncbi:MAG: nucleotide-binding protein [Thermoprotei archaeon]|nr:MAG: nucleotide-binding protein [Thermoprotei archaeon]